MSSQPPAELVEVIQGPLAETTEPLTEVCKQLPEAMPDIDKVVVVTLEEETYQSWETLETLRLVKVAEVPEAVLN